jgi:hypothetical protein
MPAETNDHPQPARPLVPDRVSPEAREKRQKIADLIGGLLARKWLKEHVSDPASAAGQVPPARDTTD